MADRARLRNQIRAEQDDFVALLRGLTEEQWATPSLCGSWTVRDATIHTAWHIHFRPLGYLKDAAQFGAFAGARFDTKQRSRDGARTNESLIEWIGTPAVINPNNLGELLIHQQDARRPLGMTREISADRLAWALSYTLSPKGGGTLGIGGGSYRRGRDLHFVATDIGWSGGRGLEVQGSAEAILMAINGRDTIDDLEGPGVEVLAGRIPARATAT